MGRPKIEQKLDDTLAFRIRSTQKKKLEKQVDQIRSRLNQSSPALYKVTFSDVIMAALRKGLPKVNQRDFTQRKERKLNTKQKNVE